MTLQEQPLPAEDVLARIEIPDDVARLIEDCEARYEVFQQRRANEAVIAFVQSDLRLVYRTLAWMRDARVLAGHTMLEWGSGVGAVALLAAGLGFDASGIEVEPELVDDAEELAETYGIEAAFACGSFLPDDAGVGPQDMDEFAWLDTSAPAAYDEVELDIDDCDLIFAYPWPGEQQVVYSLFDTYAGRGACLLTNLGLEGLRLHRKA